LIPRRDRNKCQLELCALLQRSTLDCFLGRKTDIFFFCMEQKNPSVFYASDFGTTQCVCHVCVYIYIYMCTYMYYIMCTCVHYVLLFIMIKELFPLEYITFTMGSMRNLTNRLCPSFSSCPTVFSIAFSASNLACL
jgi:hypothetical protein